MWVRLVKGAYWDYETVIAAQNDWPVPVFTQKWQSRRELREAAREFLLANVDWLVPAFGAHNIRSIAHAMAVAEQLEACRPRRFEFQMLYGMADPIKEAIQSLGYRVRIYTPYGQLLPGMAYLVRRLLENSSNDSFLRQGFAEGLSEEVLLMNPVETSDVRRRTEPETASRRDHATGRSRRARRGSPFQNEPLTDFSREANRAAMRDGARAGAHAVRPHLPGRRSTTSRCRSAKTLDSVNPSRKSRGGRQGRGGDGRAGERGGRVVPEGVRRLARHAGRASGPRSCGGWPSSSATGASSCRRGSCYETGKPWRESDADVAEAIDFCEYYALEMEKLAAPQHRDVPGEDNRYFYEPRGVAVVIAPWNFPLAILTGMATAALVAGQHGRS